MDKSLYNIFKVFFKVGFLLLGGGYVILPLLQSELCEKKGWITEEELCDYYALSQSIPGLIAANVAIFIGYKLQKLRGAFVAIIAMILPAFVSIIILAQILAEVMKFKFIESIFWGVGVGVLMLLYLAVKEMWRKSVVNKTTGCIFLASFILSVITKIPPAVIIITAIIGAVIAAKTVKDKKEGELDDLS